MSKIYISNNSWYIYDKLPTELQLNLNEFEDFYDTKPEKKHKIFILGKYIELPRYSQTYGKDYIYSNTISKSLPFTEFLTKYVIYLNKLGQDISGTQLNQEKGYIVSLNGEGNIISISNSNKVDVYILEKKLLEKKENNVPLVNYYVRRQY